MEKEMLADSLKALGDRTRFSIFDMLRGGRLCACKILERFSMTQPTLSYHMKILADAGLVTVEKDWKWSYYSLNAGAVSALARYFSEIERQGGEEK